MPTRNSSSRSPGSAGGERASRRGEARLDLEVRAAARRERALGGDPAAGDEERARVAGLARGHDEAALDRAQPREPLELAADPLERLDPVAQPRGVLVAARVGELGEAAPQPRQRSRRPLELVRAAAPAPRAARAAASGSARAAVGGASDATTPSPRFRSHT